MRILLLIVFVFSTLEAAYSEDQYKVGLARADITPKVPIRMAGYGSKDPSEGVDSKLWAKALAISDGTDEGRYLLISYESCHVTNYLYEEVYREIKDKLNLQKSQFVLSCTHTHSGPLIKSKRPVIRSTRTKEEQDTIDNYTDDLIKKLRSIAVVSFEGMQEAKISRVDGSVGFASNRRRMSQGKWAGFGDQLDGPVDHSLPILKIENSKNDLLAVLANYACHCTTLTGRNKQISGDWAGYASSIIEKKYPGAMSLVTIGCGADANPKPRGTIEMARHNGQSLAYEIDRLLNSKQSQPVRGKLNSANASIKLPLNSIERSTLEERLKGKSVAHKAHAEYFLKKLDAGETLEKEIEFAVTAWSFGDSLDMVFMNGEVVVDYALALKKQKGSSNLWITAYSNHVTCYVPSERILVEGGYEADQNMILYGHPTRFAPGVESKVMATVQDALSKSNPNR